jgi:lysophospholipase L1-like esterase
MRIVSPLLILSLSLAATACGLFGKGDKNSPMAPSGPPAAGTAIVYSVVGASDVTGVGSSKMCLPWEDCDGGGYAWAAARQLRSQGFTVTVNPLGIPAAVISRPFQDLAVQNGDGNIFNIIDSEMPFVKPEATVVSIFTGGNDVNTITSALGRGAGGSDPAGFIDQQVATFASSYVTLLNGIRDRASSARIIVLNLPNLAGLPYLAAAPLLQKQAAQRAAVGMTRTAINTLPNVLIIDMMCDPRFYQPSMYSSDGFHPNDNGYAMIAGEIVNALKSSSYPAPLASCPQMALY